MSSWISNVYEMRKHTGTFQRPNRGNRFKSITFHMNAGRRQNLERGGRNFFETSSSVGSRSGWRFINQPWRFQWPAAWLCIARAVSRTRYLAHGWASQRLTRCNSAVRKRAPCLVEEELYHCLVTPACNKQPVLALYRFLLPRKPHRVR